MSIRFSDLYAFVKDVVEPEAIKLNDGSEDGYYEIPQWFNNWFPKYLFHTDFKDTVDLFVLSAKEPNSLDHNIATFKFNIKDNELVSVTAVPRGDNPDSYEYTYKPNGVITPYTISNRVDDPYVACLIIKDVVEEYKSNKGADK